MSEKIHANKGKTRNKGHKWGKGESGNPKGRPKEGESWAAIIKEISSMTPDQIIKLVGRDNDLGIAISQLPKNVMMKKLVVARVLAALMFEPNGSLWNSLMDRAEGKVGEKVDLTTGGKVIRVTVAKDE
jgi:hypothetical protein